MTRIKFFSLSLISVLIGNLILFSAPDVAQAKTHSVKTKATSALNDASFTDTNALTVTQIQNILSANGSFLRNYREGGRSAAQIIFDASHGHGDASGTVSGISINKTINPAAILATLQKEQGLVTMKTQNDGSLNAAMGYACPDSGGCDAKYKGFTKQVENGAWQLRYSFERAKGHGFGDYQVGQSIKIDGKKVVLSSRTLASLYRYTPHLNSSFSTYFNTYNKKAVPVATVSAPGIAIASATINCNIGSKSTQRLCKIALAKSKTVTPAVVSGSLSQVSTPVVPSKVNCALGSKSTQRLCRIAQLKLK